MSEYEFVDEPPGDQYRRREAWADFAAALRENPGRWAKHPKPGETPQVRATLAAQIRRGRYKNFRPVGHFEAVSREGDVYVRYVREAEQ